VLVLPGLGDSGPQHWQTLWEQSDPAFRRVVQADWSRPDLPAWLETLQRYVAECPEPPVLLAHSLACALVAHWVATVGRGIRAAMLVSPSDVEAHDRTSPATWSFGPIPLVPFPVPSVVVASTDDSYVAPARAAFFARCWGSRLVTVAGAGHINAASGLGPWPAGRALLEALRGG